MLISWGIGICKIKLLKNFDFVVLDIVFGFLFCLVACLVCKSMRHNATEIRP